jgi:hypothetical protein
MTEEAGAVEAPSEVSDSTEVSEASPEVTTPESSEESIEVSDTDSQEVSAEPEAPQLYDIVIDGETVQVPLDDLLQGYQLRSASNKRFQEAAEERKRAAAEKEAAEKFKQALLQNPFEALTNENIPFEAIRKHYEEVVYQMLEMDQMSDEEKAAIQQQRETERLRKEYEELQQRLAEKEEAEKQRSFEQEVATQQEYWAGQIVTAIEGHGLPATPEAVQHVARTLMQAAEAEYDIDISTAVSIYKEEADTSLKGLLSQMDEDALAQLIGEERMNKIRKKDIERVQNPVLSKRPPIASSQQSDEEAASSFFDRLRQSTYRS